MEYSSYLTTRAVLLTVLAVASAAVSAESGLDRFFGNYEGQAVSDSQGRISTRDLRVKISPHEHGFTVNWVSLSHLAGGGVKRKNYIINFYTTRRPNIFQAGMRANKFGRPVPLDPMRGDPYIWARIDGPSLIVYALHVLKNGGYEIQTYVRTTTAHGLDIQYSRLRDGKMLRSVTGSLKKRDLG